jgi:hypothetical protein
MNPHMLEDLFIKIGKPAWFWPAVLILVFIVAPLACSAIEMWP